MVLVEHKSLVYGAYVCTQESVFHNVWLISKARFINKMCSFSVWNVNVDFEWATICNTVFNK